jgi:hypothetical protein
MPICWENDTAYNIEDTGIILAKECYSMRLDLLTNATVVDDAIRFVSDHQKVTNNGSKMEPSVASVDIEGEEGIIATTSNKVF